MLRNEDGFNDALLIFDEDKDAARGAFYRLFQRLRCDAQLCAGMIFAKEHHIDALKKPDLLVRYKRPPPRNGWTLFVSELVAGCEVDFQVTAGG